MQKNYALAIATILVISTITQGTYAVPRLEKNVVLENTITHYVTGIPVEASQFKIEPNHIFLGNNFYDLNSTSGRVHANITAFKENGDIRIQVLNSTLNDVKFRISGKAVAVQVDGVFLTFPDRWRYILNDTVTEVDVNNGRNVFVGFEDSDGDGLLDTWEVSGIDANSDRTIDLNLQALGANPRYKDIFVEVDYMEFHRPAQVAIDNVILAFRNAPVSNPNGTAGINLHVEIPDLSEQITHQNFLTIWSGFDTIKNANFGTVAQRSDPNSTNILAAKRLAYHYALFIHNQAGTTSSGVSECPTVLIPGPCNDFVVSLGSFTTVNGHAVGSVDEQAGTFMHELGHNMGLRHGGGDVTNCKPNYLSLMSYSFQFSRFGAITTNRPLDYSRETIASLNEINLNETLGVPALFSYPQGSRGLTTIYGQNGTNPMPRANVTEVPIDWNRDGDSLDPRVHQDINNLGIFDCGLDANGNLNTDPNQTLTGFNDWISLQYNFKAGRGFADGVHADPSEIPEITVEILDQMEVATRVPVRIDIKPGSDPNSVSLSDTGLLPVAIFGSSSFDVTKINLETIELGGASLATRGSAKAPKLAFSFEDVNGDGLTDMMTFFSVQELVNRGALTSTTKALALTANLFDGIPILGIDSVNVVP